MRNKRMMTVMSFNVLCSGKNELAWQKRIPLVVRTIRKADPDTFGVQEAHIGWMRALKAAFPDYDYVGVGRDNGKKRGEFAAVFFKKTKYQVMDSGSFWLNETPDIPKKGWDAACIRICSYAELKEKKTGRTFVHMNTHLDHVGSIAMQNGAELIAERAAAFGSDVPVILTGDMNAEPDAAPCQTFRNAGFTDARDAAAICDKAYTYHDYQPDNPIVHSVIDYVFVKGDISVRKHKVIRKKIDGCFPSDHFPVVAELDL